MSQQLSGPQELAKSVALDVASEPDEVGEFVVAHDDGDNITDFRFASRVRGYENWQWSVTLFHDEELDSWTVDESSLIPAEGALLPPQWIPWKDRLLPEDLSVTDSLGTEADDPRIEQGMPENVLESAERQIREGAGLESADSQSPTDGVADAGSAADAGEAVRAEDASASATVPSSISGDDKATSEEFSRNAEDLADAAVAFHLTRSHVMTAEGRAETAKRWYAGQHGPKSLSTKTADGLTCEECGFLIPLQGELGRMFAVCANKWSPDDGKVVSLDHGCGEHSEIEAAEASPLWVQSEPAYDDVHVDIVRRSPVAALGAEKLSPTASEPASDTELPEVEILESIEAEPASPTATRAASKRRATGDVAPRKRTARRTSKSAKQTGDDSGTTSETE
ncbi:DUF3027 domain-containing protein [Bifidobacterium crudilactis]|jgi:hypothetical protein|uniref:DUF3027 domain-containing protein n=1 Tax=Bifidobacterium crudilactis TaxID=327277 RepID=UPI0023553DE3|nr:DUF3027 domain-containing protein [Bifidobacterium crudilactis]MCI1868057.1 DUF3027 domain-containing protein [Bifidobacterium crudilactis]MDN5971528.1 DUF3027 domain-containing protein [Bifidobacterium crudilactis]MDN6000686.1 DUF3027 domain-containing protein [Bifidobacterium crudilactis]MDN6209218.1 DUF3027 domain-containing protein [Bifidobacterium crudilactis]MDN6424889.1 DUF3027 domain-containing protein [Bifidobacterium crudilactis]